MSVKGIDIYEGDNVEDWNVVRQQGIEVVIQKASQGTTHIDKLLQYRYPRIRQAELKLGFYHFANNTNNPEEQAQFFLQTIEGLKNDTVLWLDIEGEDKWDKQAAINFANAFIHYIQNKGFKIGIYTGLSFYNDYLSGNIPEAPLWIASYGKQPPLFPDNASWQHSETGNLNGIVGNVDLDYFIDDIYFKKEDEEMLENVVCYNNQVDKRAAEYLADYLCCPTIDNAAVNYDYSKVKNIYCVGGGTFTTFPHKSIGANSDRWNVIIEVLKFCGKL